MSIEHRVLNTALLFCTVLVSFFLVIGGFGGFNFTYFIFFGVFVLGAVGCPAGGVGVVPFPFLLW